jgi:hypothetical protein
VQRAEAKQRAEATGRQLAEFASFLDGDRDDFVFAPSDREDDGSEPEEEKRREEEKAETEPDTDTGSSVPQISDWA